MPAVVSITELMSTPIVPRSRIEWRALELWRRREQGWPGFVRSDPTEWDRATGAWERIMEEARLGG